MDLRAYLEVAGPEGRPYRLPARTVDLSTAGAGLIAHRPVNIARVTAVIVEDRTATHHRQRRWRGRVVHEREIDEGRRLGISFDRPDQGPTITFRLQVAGRGERRVRLDRPFAVVEPAEEAPPGQSNRQSEAFQHGAGLFRGAALLGLTLDQVLKALLATAPAGAIGPPGMGELIPAMLGLGTVGVIARLADRPEHASRPVLSTGMGLMLGGILSTLLDRVAAGGPRLLEGCPMGPAEALTAAGASIVLGSLLVGQGRELIRASGPVAADCQVRVRVAET